MAFWNDVGNYFGNIFGTQQSKNATDYNQTGASNLSGGANAAAASAQNAQDQANHYQNAAQQSYGANATDTLNMANKAAQGGAQTAARGAGSVAAGNARAAGLNKGQAAITGSNAGTATYQEQIPQQIGNYMNAANALNQSGQNYTGLSQQGTGLQIGAGQAAATAGATNSAQTQQGGGGLLAGIGNGLSQLFSDKRLKKDMKKDMNLEEILKKVRPINYRYKDESEAAPERMGVTAQDLEKTPMQTAVKDTPQGKMIDTNQLTPQVLNLVLQLGDEVQKMKEAMK